MNLHSIVAPYIAAVNPMLLVGVRVSVGSTQNQAGRRAAAYATPGSITASIDDGTGQGIAGSILTVSAVASGVLQVGQALADVTSVLEAATTITGQLSGAVGGVGTYLLSNQQLVTAETMTTSLTLPGQVQPMTFKDLMQVEGLNLNGKKKAIYLNGSIDGVVRIELKGGDLITLPDGTVWLVAQQLEDFSISSGWCKAAMVLQDGS